MSGPFVPPATPGSEVHAKEVVESCDVCHRDVIVPAGKRSTHPCRFEIACVCWYGIPCSGRGTVAGTTADRKAAGL